LPISLAEGSIAASMGQLRLVDPVVHAKGAEFAPAVSVDLTQSAIDARLVLSGPAGADTATGGHPDISVRLKGPMDAPRRTLEVNTLANWLALRAVDQKAKRVDALEQAARERPLDGEESTGTPAEREPIATGPAATTAPPRAARPISVPSPVTGPVTAPIVGPVGQPRPRPVLPIPDPAATIGGPVAKPSDDPRLRRPTPTVEQAPLPPPIDLRPPAPPHGPRG
jgi:hypothetical protein